MTGGIKELEARAAAFESVSASIDRLVDIAISVLHHDGTETDKEVQWERWILRERFEIVINAMNNRRTALKRLKRKDAGAS